MAALICGSLAYDTVMVYPGRFRDQILANKIHMLNVSFMVPTLRRYFGGCAGNIAYNLKLLGGDGQNARSTANLCTPGTNVVMNDKLILAHCTNSKSKTFHGEGWVTAEVEVKGYEVIRHFINGELVLEYNKPQLDDRDAHAKELIQKAGDKMLSSGSISLQSESHPVEFRKVELLDLSSK